MCCTDGVSVFNGYQAAGYAPLTPTSPGGGRPYANGAQQTLEALYAAAGVQGADFGNPYGQMTSPQTGLPHSFHAKVSVARRAPVLT